MDPAAGHHFIVAAHNPDLLAALVERCAKQLDMSHSLSIADFAKASAKLARAMLKRGWATREVISERKAACLRCPHRKTSSANGFDASNLMLGDHDYCGACGCSLKFKVRLAAEDCPVEGDRPGLSRWTE